MSQQSAQAFVTQASQNHELLAQVAQSAGKLQMLNSPQGLTLATEQYEAATTVARQGGYDFNPSELESAFIAFVATHRDLLANRQLTEADATIGERCSPSDFGATQRRGAAMAISMATLDLAALVQAAEDDSNEAPWMTVPEFQYVVARLLVGILSLHHRRHRLGWHVGGELGVSMPRPEGGTLTLGPDVLVAVADETLRTTWDIRREGQAPKVVLEVVTTESVTRDTDPEQKPAYYAAMGVAEYVVYWPYRAESGPRLFGYRRDGLGRWVEWGADANGILWSAALGGLGLLPVERPWLRVVDQQGRVLPSPEEEAEQTEQARERAEQATLRAEREQRRAERETVRAEHEALRAEHEASHAQRERARAEQAVEHARQETERAEREAAARRTAESELARLRALLAGRSDSGDATP